MVKILDFVQLGGPRGIRTPDLLNAIQSCSQLGHGSPRRNLYECIRSICADSLPRKWKSATARYRSAMERGTGDEVSPGLVRYCVPGGSTRTVMMSVS